MLNIRFFFFSFFIAFCLNTKFYSSKKIEEYKIRIISYGDIEIEKQKWEDLNIKIKSFDNLKGNIIFDYVSCKGEEDFKEKLNEFYTINIILIQPKSKNDSEKITLSNLICDEYNEKKIEIDKSILLTKQVRFYLIYIDYLDDEKTNDLLENDGIISCNISLTQKYCTLNNKKTDIHIYLRQPTITKKDLWPFLEGIIKEQNEFKTKDHNSICHCDCLKDCC